MDIKEISKNILTQDNLATDLPIFCVQQRNRIYGMDSGSSENYVWMDDEWNEVDKELSNLLEKHYNGEIELKKYNIDNYERVYYRDIWEFVTACFTKVGAENYIKANGHNLTEPRIYVASGYRNAEWAAIRNLLKSFA